MLLVLAMETVCQMQQLKAMVREEESEGSAGKVPRLKTSLEHRTRVELRDRTQRLMWRSE